MNNKNTKLNGITITPPLLYQEKIRLRRITNKRNCPFSIVNNKIITKYNKNPYFSSVLKCKFIYNEINLYWLQKICQEIETKNRHIIGLIEGQDISTLFYKNGKLWQGNKNGIEQEIYSIYNPVYSEKEYLDSIDSINFKKQKDKKVISSIDSSHIIKCKFYPINENTVPYDLKSVIEILPHKTKRGIIKFLLVRYGDSEIYVSNNLNARLNLTAEIVRRKQLDLVD